MRKPLHSKLTSDYHRAVGRLVVASGELESIMTDLIGAFAWIPDIRYTIAVVHHQQASSKAETLCALMKLAYGDDTQLKQIIDEVNRAKELCAFRNGIVHAYWNAKEDGSVETIRFTARSELKRQRTPRTYQEIDKKADEAFGLADWLQGLRDSILEGLPPNLLVKE